MSRSLIASVGMALGVAVTAAACASLATRENASPKNLTPRDRLTMLRQSQVWSRTNIRSLDLRSGPPAKDGFTPGETVTCKFVPHKFDGRSPKFECELPDGDEVKVKFGRNNGEVFGEVAGTRLLWALGFGADRMYPVRVICHGCPAQLEGSGTGEGSTSVFDTAAIERKAPGETIEMYDHQGWAWSELDLVSEAAGGASRAERDALKLLAVFMQFGDNKPEQQKLVCLDKDFKRKDEKPAEKGEPNPRVACQKPFMMIDDLGLSFGGVDLLDRQSVGSVNFAKWSAAPVWKGARGCTGNLTGSIRASLQEPEISEEGRAFLATLLDQLSDAQIHDLFEVAQFGRRPSDPSSRGSRPASVDTWVQAFKRKRQEIATRRCNDPFVVGGPTAASVPALLLPPQPLKS